jgi:hypothetical protein
MVIDQRFSVWAQESPSSSQAENASSILVARSNAFRLQPNDYKSFQLTSSDRR